MRILKSFLLTNESNYLSKIITVVKTSKFQPDENISEGPDLPGDHY